MNYRIVKQFDGRYEVLWVRESSEAILVCEAFQPQLSGFKTIEELKSELAKLQTALEQPILERLSYTEDYYKEEVK